MVESVPKGNTDLVLMGLQIDLLSHSGSLYGEYLESKLKSMHHVNLWSMPPEITLY